MQIDDKFFKNYKEVIISVLIILVMAVVGIRQIISAASKIQTTKQEHTGEKSKLEEIKKSLVEQEEAKKALLIKQNKIKPVFDPKNGAEDSIASFGGMFEDVIDYIKMNSLRLRTVSYQISPAEDQIYASFPNLYSVCKVNLLFIGTYLQFEGFLRDLSLYPYFINIAEVQIAPYEKNKQYLMINFSIDLYAKKQQSASSVMNK